MVNREIIIRCWAGIIGLLLLVGCGSGGSGGGSTPETGSVSIGLTDATTQDYAAVYITVREVRVSRSSATDADTTDEEDWLVVATPNATYNLLELVNGVIQTLGVADLETGEYNQIRLILGEAPDGTTNINGAPHPYANYLIRTDTQAAIELMIPSGLQTGIKIVGGFTIDADQQTDLVLDFNVIKSIVQAGASGKWLLKPTVKVLDQQASASVNGIVYEIDQNGDAVPLEGAMVNAQAIDDDDGIEMVSAATVTDETGGYKLLLQAGIYRLVALAPGYHTATAEVTVAANDAVEQVFLMEPALDGMGTIYGSVNIVNGDDDQSISIGIRDADGVEIASTSVANGGSYWFDLPEGVYSMVAIFSLNGEMMTLEANSAFELLEGTAIVFDILFENKNVDPGKPDKIIICHKGREITISSSALQAHLNHGDIEGSCDAGGEDDSAGDDGTDGETTGDDNTGPTSDTDDAGDNDGSDPQFTICHKGRTITVNASALDAHLNHGDTIAACTD